MLKIVGSLVRLIVLAGTLSFSMVASPSLELKLTTLQGGTVSLNALCVGVPYLLEIIGNDMSSLPSMEMAGLEGWHYEPRGSYKSITTVNGVTTQAVRATYYIRANKPGRYALGPVRCTVGNDSIRSAALSVNVGTETSGHIKKESMFLELTTSTPQIYVGQSLKLSITFYIRSDIQVLECTPPSFSHPLVEKKAFATPHQSMQTIGKQLYQCVRWDVEIKPDQLGSLLLPAATLSCLTKATSPLGVMRSMLGSLGWGNKHHEVSSEPLLIKILPLPPYDKPVDAVGSFSSLQASLSEESIKEGEAAVLTLTLESEASVDKVKNLRLLLPDTLNFYASKVSKSIEQEGRHKKSFEYVLQGAQAGTWTVPEQEFTFFDPQDQQYKTLNTQPLRLKVEALPVAKPSVPGISSTHTRLSIEPQQEDTFPLNATGPWVAVPSPSLNIYIFILLCLAPLLFISIKERRTFYLLLSQTKVLRRRNALKKLRYSIREYQEQKEIKILAQGFNDFAATFYPYDPLLPTMDLLKTVVSSMKFTPVEQKAWEEFLHNLQAYQYSETILEKEQHASLEKGAKVWLQRFQGAR